MAEKGQAVILCCLMISQSFGSSGAPRKTFGEREVSIRDRSSLTSGYLHCLKTKTGPMSERVKPRGERMSRPDESKKTALVAEDDAIFRKVVVRGLQRHGYTVKEAINGAEGIRIFDESAGEITLIVSDIRMPEVDGVAFLNHVRSKSKVPFIVMTGYSEVVDKSDIFEIGATDLLAKPFNFDKLVESVERSLSAKAADLSA